MDVELDPPQPTPVEDAIESLLAAEAQPGSDPWWTQGALEAFES